MDNISIERIWQDQEFYKIRMMAQSKYVCATIDIFVQDITDLANTLAVYPQNAPEYFWKQEYESKSLSFHVTQKDKCGHLLVEIGLFSNELGDEYQCCFRIETEIGLLNIFGQRLLQVNKQDSIGTKIVLNEFGPQYKHTVVW